MAQVPDLEELAFKTLLPSLGSIQDPVILDQVIKLLYRMNVVGDRSKERLQAAVHHFGYQLLKEHTVVLCTSSTVLHQIISSNQLRCDEGTIIDAIFIKFRQVFNRLNDRYAVTEPTCLLDIAQLLKCVDTGRLRLSDEDNETSLSIYQEMIDKLGLWDDQVSSPNPEFRGSGFRELLTVEPYNLLHTEGDSPGFETHEKSGFGCDYFLDFTVKTRKTLGQVWFGCCIPIDTVLRNHELTVIVHLLADGQLVNTYSTHTRTLTAEEDGAGTVIAVSTRLNFDNLELLPGKKYRMDSSLRDITRIQRSHLTIITFEMNY